ncbi:MAG: NAD-dependent epimerase/dehydratase family protein [Bdellovibrionales bacterium]|nr:NAD-dependent epimerase/dehydratase family protein [Bdellovibrionales bacterium]
MTALIIGASGLVGGHCLEKLLKSNKYDRVISVGRRKLDIAKMGQSGLCSAAQATKLEQIILELEDLEKHQAELKADDYFCCLGTTIKKAKTKENFKKVDFDAPYALARIAKHHKADNFVVVTALGANSKSMVFYNKVKGELEDALKKLNLKKLSIIQPSLLLGERKEFRLGERLFEGFKYLPIWFGPLKKYQPIEAERVAQMMVDAAG